jgi:hypothetical protein
MRCRTICTTLIDSLARHIVFISNHMPNDSGEKSMLPHRPAGFWLPMTFAGAAALVLSAYVSLYRDIHHDMVLVVVLLSCGSYAFWQTRDRGWRSVFTVGGVVATLLLLDMILLFPHLPDQVFRARVVKGIAAGLHLYRPLTVACVFFTMLSMLVASVAHHALKRRLIASSVSVVGVGLLITGMIAYVRANPPVREFAPPPPLGASTDEVLLSAENVPPEWELDAIGKGSGKPEAIVTKDIQYGPHGWRNQLNLFRPKSVDKPVPVVVYLHGGWVIGDKDGEGYQEPWVDALLANGIAVAPINYRLAPSTYLGGDPNGTLFPMSLT